MEMITRIKITAGSVVLDGELCDTGCGRAISEMLPIEASPHEWGDEFYFNVPLEMDLDETATVNVKIGDIGYWPPGPSLAIFFGPTPLSRGEEPVPASEVNCVGRVTGDARQLKREKGIGRIRIDKA